MRKVNSFQNPKALSPGVDEQITHGFNHALLL
jgi:hypothetical protein